MNKHLLVGCSFTDPLWQDEIPWSVYYGKKYQTSYIVAKAGMGWNGICTEAYMYAQNLKFDHCVIMLPTIFRMDIELNHEGDTCNGMVDLLENDRIITNATRKWITSRGLNWNQTKILQNQQKKMFDQLYKYMDFLPLIREQVLKLKLLILSLQAKNISYTITAIKDPMHQLEGLDYIKDDIIKLLNDVEYKDWLRFNNGFIDEFLGHGKHPTTQEHKLIGDYIWQSRLT